MRVVVVFGFLFFWCIGFVCGATINAASCSQGDVQAAIDSASDGDTVNVPAGSCSWTSSVVIPNSKGIEIIGAGMGQTAIILNTNTAINIRGSSGTSSRITGFSFDSYNSGDTDGVS